MFFDYSIIVFEFPFICLLGGEQSCLSLFSVQGYSHNVLQKFHTAQFPSHHFFPLAFRATSDELRKKIGLN